MRCGFGRRGFGSFFSRAVEAEGTPLFRSSGRYGDFWRQELEFEARVRRSLFGKSQGTIAPAVFFFSPVPQPAGPLAFVFPVNGSFSAVEFLPYFRIH
jgi:hypothetical protein